MEGTCQVDGSGSTVVVMHYIYAHISSFAKAMATKIFPLGVRLWFFACTKALLNREEVGHG